MKGFGVQSRDIKLNGQVRKGYRAEQFHDAWRRYLTLSATRATRATSLFNENKKVAEVAEVAPGRGNGANNCVQCGKPGADLQAAYGDAAAHLHRSCSAAWQAAQDLDIPPFLDRRGAR